MAHEPSPPAAQDSAVRAPAAEPLARQRGRLDPLAGWGISLGVHALILLAFAQIAWLVAAGPGGQESEVAIVPEGSTPLIQKGSALLTLTETAPVSLDAAAPAQLTATPQPIESLAAPSTLPGGASVVSLTGAMEAIIATQMTGGTPGKADWAGVTIGGGGGEGGTFEGLVKNLQRNGFDIVITFDSTGSMRGEIDEVRSKIDAIGAALLKLVPKTRISLCTYRDQGDEYVVKGMPLSSDLPNLQAYLNGINANGGGDYPEAVHEALKWAVANNEFQGRARKIILLFGDAPPHREFVADCLDTARKFHDRGGIISTVTCGRGGERAMAARLGAIRGGPAAGDARIPEFVQIAEVGGGEAFLMTDTRQIMTQLMVLAFGSKHKDKVVEALKLTGM